MDIINDINLMIDAIKIITDYIDSNDEQNPIRIKFLNDEIFETNKSNCLMILFGWLPYIYSISWEGPNFLKQATLKKGINIENEQIFSNFQLEYSISSYYMIILDMDDYEESTNSFKIVNVIKIT